VTGDTLVLTNAGEKTVKELAEQNAQFFVESFDTEKKEVVKKSAVAFKTKDDAKILELKTKSGKKIRLTPDHRVYTQRGWVEAADLTKDDKILSFDSK
jgi:ribonucleoside-diphosphate reductase alpha chain